MAVLKALLGYLQSNSNTADLQPIQKHVPIQFLAIRNALGDYGLNGDLRAFMNSPSLEVRGTGETATATLKFVGALPKTTTKVLLRGRLINARSFDIADSQHPSDISLTNYGEDVLLVEALDVHDVLVEIGVPTMKRVGAAPQPAYASPESEYTNGD
jgi:hypothetical protein